MGRSSGNERAAEGEITTSSEKIDARLLIHSEESASLRLGCAAGGPLVVDSLYDTIYVHISHFPSIQVLSHYIQVLSFQFDSAAKQLHAFFP